QSPVVERVERNLAADIDRDGDVLGGAFDLGQRAAPVGEGADFVGQGDALLGRFLDLPGVARGQCRLGERFQAVEEGKLRGIALLTGLVEAGSDGERGTAEEDDSTRSNHDLPDREPPARSRSEGSERLAVHKRMITPPWPGPWRAPLPSAPSWRACRPGSWAVPAGS